MATPSKRTRARTAKVRTGCITCKIRHVKCDEAKPSCHRCTSTGRTCDGYAHLAQKTSARRPLAVREADLDKKQLSVVPLTRDPGFCVSADPTELRGFHFFETRTGNELIWKLSAPALDVSYFFQLAFSSSAVKHSAVALGLMGERLQISNVCTSKNAVANVSHLSAQTQYQKAIRELRELLQKDDDDSLCAALVSCLMLLCFEFLQGNETGALTHLAMGYRVLNLWRARSPPERPELGAGDSVTKLEGMTRIFNIFDIQSSMWVKKHSFVWPEAGPIWLQLHQKLPSPAAFNNLYEAEGDLEAIKLKLVFLQRAKCAAVPPGDCNWTKNVQEQEVELAQDMVQWPLALKAYNDSRGSNITLREINLGCVLQINHHLASTQLAAYFAADRDEYYRGIHADFVESLEIIRPLIEPTNILVHDGPLVGLEPHDTINNPMPTFSFCPGLIEPLYFIAVTTDDPKLQREALRLLVSEPWREGAWDSLAMAKIAIGKIKAKARESTPSDGWSDTTSSGSSPSPLMHDAFMDMSV